jgi:hypothetical protein
MQPETSFDRRDRMTRHFHELHPHLSSRWLKRWAMVHSLWPVPTSNATQAERDAWDQRLERSRALQMDLAYQNGKRGGRTR